MGFARWLVAAQTVLLAASPIVGADAAVQARSPGTPSPGPAPSGQAASVGSGRAYGANGAARATSKSDASTFEVGGMKLGMSADEVERVARSRNLTTGEQKRLQSFDETLDGDRMPSFDTMAANFAADRLDARRPAPVRVINHVVLRDRDGNRYDLRFVPLEQGPALNSIFYTTSMNGNSAATYLAALKKRYGPPYVSSIGPSGFNASWCARNDPTCETSPHLKVTSDGAEVSMNLNHGYLFRKALDQRIEAKAAALAAAGARKPVF